jgi:hypothetical protein
MQAKRLHSGNLLQHTAVLSAQLQVPAAKSQLRKAYTHLSLASPDAQDEGHLDLGQVHEVLGDVDGDLVQESGGDVEACVSRIKLEQKMSCHPRRCAQCLIHQQSAGQLQY